MNFYSDNVAGAAPEILTALAEGAAGSVPSYGGDPATARVERRLAAIFETEVVAFPVATGTAANALALSALCPSFGAVYCHAESHVQVDECGAPEFYTGGAKLVPLDGIHGRIAPAELERALAAGGAGDVHHVQPAALSIGQLSEAGTAYTPGHVAELAAVARRHGVGVHMDGARFANALVGLGSTPAELTWKAGVDVLSFGATKNGALAAEAVLVFDAARAADLAFRRKRGGHLFSKMRVLSAQLAAYLADDLWLTHARHANAQAARLAHGLAEVPGARLVHPADANEVFVELPEIVAEGLEADGFRFYRWPGTSGRPTLRLVAAFNTDANDVDAFLASARQHGRRG